MKRPFVIASILILIGVIVMTQVTAQRMNGSPFASEQNAVQDLSGWVENSTTRTWTFVSANAGNNTFVVYASGDVTSFIYPSLRLRAKQGAGYLYFITHAVSAYDALNDRTSVTLFGGTNYDLANSAISDVAFSTLRFPLGFAVGEEYWSVEVVDSSLRQQASPVSGTWYNLGTTNTQISIPVGTWNVSYKVSAGAGLTSLTSNVYVTLSTANNTESNTKLSSFQNIGISTVTNLLIEGTLQASDEIVIASETTYYLNAKTGTTGVPDISFGGATIPTIITAVSAYY